MRVYNKANRTFGLRDMTGKISFFIKPSDFADIPAEYEGDQTLRFAVAAGELVPYESTKQADNIEKAAETEKLEKRTRARKEV